jgi:glycosyltransferase involved in cell wall biosynthesis
MAAVFRTRAKKFLIEAGKNLNTVVLIFNPYQTPEGPVFCLWGPPILSTCKHWNGFWAQYSPYSKEKGRQRGRVRRWPNWVSLLGNQDSLVDTYARAAVVINPVKFGTGLPVKTIEALSYGKPIVATSAGGRDLEDFSDAI